MAIYCIASRLGSSPGFRDVGAGGPPPVLRTGAAAIPFPVGRRFSAFPGFICPGFRSGMLGSLSTSPGLCPRGDTEGRPDVPGPPVVVDHLLLSIRALPGVGPGRMAMTDRHRPGHGVFRMLPPVAITDRNRCCTPDPATSAGGGPASHSRQPAPRMRVPPLAIIDRHRWPSHRPVGPVGNRIQYRCRPGPRVLPLGPSCVFWLRRCRWVGIFLPIAMFQVGPFGRLCVFCPL